MWQHWSSMCLVHESLDQMLLKNNQYGNWRTCGFWLIQAIERYLVVRGFGRVRQVRKHCCHNCVKQRPTNRQTDLAMVLHIRKYLPAVDILFFFFSISHVTTAWQLIPVFVCLLVLTACWQQSKRKWRRVSNSAVRVGWTIFNRHVPHCRVRALINPNDTSRLVALLALPSSSSKNDVSSWFHESFGVCACFEVVLW